MGDTVSIVVPTYNRAGLLKETIESVISQAYGFWELIIVDDGSSDNTAELVEGFKDERVRFLKRNRLPKGAPTCRNIGVENASGKYVMFLDSDDLLLPGTLQQRMEALQANKNLDFLVFETAFFEDSVADAAVLWNRFNAADDLLRFLEGDIVWHTSGSVFQRSFLKNNGYKFAEDLQSSQDWQFHLQILLNQPAYLKIASLPDVFIRRDKKSTRISDEHATPQKILNRLALMKQLMDQQQIKENGLYVKSLVKTVFREFLLLLNQQKHFDAKLLAGFKSYLHRDAGLLDICQYLQRGNKLAAVHFYLWRMYNKLAGANAKNFLSNRSQYRSPMTKEEQAALTEHLQQQKTGIK